jgi:UDP-N-acetylglucosamine 4-epimerase
MLIYLDLVKNLRVLVTGGAGFIGSNIVETLLNNGVQYVRVLDNLSTGNKKNLELLIKKYSNLEFMYGDISNLETCRLAVKNIDVVCHQAALGSVPRSIISPLDSHISNVNGFLNILLASKENNIKRVVYASSSSVYGDNPMLPKCESDLGNVLSPYAATKLVDEIYAGVFTRCYNMECIGMRYFNVFGPRQDPNGAYAAVIPKFIDTMLRGDSITINGDGTYSRDFTYIDNVVQANILGLTTTNENAYGQCFNIGLGGCVSLIELYNVIRDTLDLDEQHNPIFGNIRDGDIPHSHADISKAQILLGYDPSVSFSEGINKTVKYYKTR